MKNVNKSFCKSKKINIETIDIQYQLLDIKYIKSLADNLPSSTSFDHQHGEKELSNVVVFNEHQLNDNTPMKMESVGDSTFNSPRKDFNLTPDDEITKKKEAEPRHENNLTNEDMKTEIQKEVGRQLSSLLSSIDITDTRISPRRLPPIMATKSNSPRDLSSSMTPTDVKYALARLERKEKNANQPKALYISYNQEVQDDNNVVHEFLAVSPSTTFIIPSVNEFLDNASLGRKLKNSKKKSSQQNEFNLSPENPSEELMSPSAPYDENKYSSFSPLKISNENAPSDVVKILSFDNNDDDEFKLKNSSIDDTPILDSPHPKLEIQHAKSFHSPPIVSEYSNANSNLSSSLSAYVPLQSSDVTTTTTTSTAAKHNTQQSNLMSSTQKPPPIRHEVRQSEVLRFVKSNADPSQFLDELSKNRSQNVNPSENEIQAFNENEINSKSVSIESQEKNTKKINDGQLEEWNDESEI